MRKSKLCIGVLAGLLFCAGVRAELVLPGADREPDTRENPAPEDFLRLPARPAAPPPASAPEPEPPAEPASEAGSRVIDRNLSPQPDAPRSLTGVHEHEPMDALEGEFVFTADLLSNAAGGADTGLAAVGLGEFLGSVDGDALGWWPGGRLGLHLAYALGGSPSDKVGDVSGVSGIDAGGATGLFVWDAWAQQRLPWWNTRVRLGVLDFNNHFYVSDYANLFVNGAFGMGTEISGDGRVHTYPATGPGMLVGSVPLAGAYLKLGVWQGVPSTKGILRNGDGGWFYVGEGGIARGVSGAPGYLKLGLGLWRQTDTLQHWAGEDWQAAGRSGPAFANDPKVGHGGAYVVAETAVGRRLGLFFKAGRADSDRSRYGTSYAGGAQLLGLLPGRPDDALGVGLVRTVLSDQYRSYAQSEGSAYFQAETVYEVTYSAQLGWLMVQPDFQYVLQPGMDPFLGNAIVVGLRLQAWW